MTMVYGPSRKYFHTQDLKFIGLKNIAYNYDYY